MQEDAFPIIENYLIALSIMPFTKYFCKQKYKVTIGIMPSRAPAAAAPMSLDVIVKKLATDKVTVLICGD